MNTTKGHSRPTKCAGCSTKGRPVYHEGAEGVRDCFAREYDEQAQVEAEREAEARAERFYEEGTPAQHMAYLGELEMEERALVGRF